MADPSFPAISDVPDDINSSGRITLQSRRARLVGAGLALGLTVTGATVWNSPALRHNVVGGVLNAAPLSKGVEDGLRKIADAPPASPSDARLQALIETMSQALREGDVSASRALSRRLLVALKNNPRGGDLLARAGLSVDTVRRVARSGASTQRPSQHASTDSPRGAERARSWKPGDTNGRPWSGTTVPIAAADKRVKKPTRCWEFKFQQDAQAVYAANLADPYGLDGKAGPRNDDGLACAQLPVDPARKPSEPIWAYVGNPPPRPDVLNPSRRYFGVFVDQAPFNFAELNQAAKRVEHTPNSVTWFSGWDQNFRADAAVATWRRGMLPIVAWESRPNVTDMSSHSRNSVNPDYQLADIIAGRYDDYIRAYARDVAAFQLPVGLRFNHEMNGIWYPWAEQVNGNRRGEYVAAWRHVHDLFKAEGATNAIWIWAPNTIEFPQAQPLDQLYPGDDYVDWVGLTGYYRKRVPGKAATFDNTYGTSLAALRAAAPGKPIFLTEIGVTDSGGTKVAWIKSFFAAMRDNPDIIGFTWFQTHVTAVPLGKKLPVTNDWGFTSTPAVAEAFRAGIRDAWYGEGLPVQPKTPLPASSPTPTPEGSASSEPTPSTAAPSEPTPSTATPSEPAPSTATPSTATPSTATPSTAAPSEPTPSATTPSATTSSEPSPAQPTSSRAPVTAAASDR